MPQPTQHSLIPFLLLWITVLSIVQVVFIVFFFTAGHHNLSQKSSAVAPERPMHFQANNTHSSPSEHGLLLGKGKMLTFQATQDERQMKWLSKNPDKGLVSEEEGGRVLKIMRDGYFLLNLQVTLSSCNATGASQHTVSMKSDNKSVILQGQINAHSCSTGLLGKVEELSAGSSLEVHLPTPEELNESLTHLDIIYMYKP